MSGPGSGGGFGGPSSSGGPTARGGGGSGPTGNEGVNSAGGDTGGNANGQDGQICCSLECLGLESGIPTQLQFPDGLPPIANYSLIGARPHNLGAMLRGDGRVPTPGFDEGKSLEWMALAETPMTHRHGYGVSFAIGRAGTVSPSSGAFVHPFTLLTLPAAARRMGLALELLYLSNAEHAVGDPQLFSQGYVLSGHDLLMETEGSTGTTVASKVQIARGDGLPARYTLQAGSGPPVWTYSASLGVYDTLTAEVISGAVTYTRTLRDGRKIIYNERVATSGFGSGHYVRTKVVDGYSNQILYTWIKTAGVAYLTTITDTRGVQLVFTTDNGSPRRLTKLAINAATVQLYPSVPAADLEINFTYTSDGARRLQRIQWFKTRVVADANGNGLIESGEDTVVQPAVDLVYEAHNKLGEIWNSTRAPSTRQIQNVYALHTGFGVRVVTQREGGTGTSGVATHTYSYPSSTSRTYIDPRGTAVSLSLDYNEFRPNVVTMTASTAGKPRDAEPTTPGDHQSLSWTLGYGCCGLPATITEFSSGRVWTMGWDKNSLLSVAVNGTVLHTFTNIDGRMLTWTPANDTTPRLTVQYTPATGAYSSVDLTTRTYADARAVVRPAASKTLTFGAGGQLIQTQHNGHGASVVSAYSYLSTGAGHGLLRTIAGPDAGAALALTFTGDDLGRLSAVERGLAGGARMTSFVVDTHDRVQSISALATASGPALASETYYDEFSEVSWERTANRDETGALRTRPWIQSIVVRDALGRAIKRFRDSALVTASQESMLLTQMTWAADHRLDTVVQPNGATTTYVFDGYGFFYKSSVSAAGGFGPVTTTRHFYDENGLLKLARNDLGHALQIQRHYATQQYAGLVEKVIDPANLNQLEFVYDSHRRLLRTNVRGGNGGIHRVIDHHYDEIGQLSRVAVYDVFATAISNRIQMYDGVGRLVEVGLQADSTDSEYKRGFLRAFDDYGRMLSQRDRLSDHISASLGDLWNQVSFSYHPLTGLPDRMIEREIEQAASEFGPLTASGSHSVHTYETHLGHDLLDRPTTVDQKPEGVTGASVLHKYFHDSLDHVVRFEDVLNAKLEWEYDGLGEVRRRTERGTAGGAIPTSTDTDYVNGVVTRVDAEQRTSRFYYDKAWRLTKQELPGATVGGVPFTHVFDYDAASRMRWMVNGNGVKIHRLYDAAGRLTTQYVEPNTFHSILATREVYQYNVYGNVSLAQTFLGTNLDVHVVTEAFSEDAWGRTTSEQFDFGGVSRTVQSLYGVAGGAQDFLARRGLTVPDAYDVRTEVDGLGRSWQYNDALSSAHPGVAQYRFVGQRVRERQQARPVNVGAWSLSTSNEWNALRRLTVLQTNRTAGNVQLSRFEHEYDSEGHVKKRKRDRIGNSQPAGVGDWFKLDEYYRLAGVKLGVGASQFGNAYNQGSDFDAVTSFQRSIDYSPAAGPLDKAQNRHLVRETVGSTTTDTAYAVNSNSHRYDLVSGVPLTYDSEGNTLFDGAFHYRYDFKNRLSEVYLYVPASGEQALSSGTGSRSAGTMRDRPRYLVPSERLQRIYMRGRDRFASAARTREGLSNLGRQGALADQSSTTSSVEGNLQLVAFYAYDPYNRRVLRMLPDQPILYSTWDGWREVAEYTFGGAWAPQRSYVWGGRIDELIRYSDNVQTPGTWKHYFPQHDHQDSVDMLVEADGTPKEKYEYDPFGGVQVFGWNGAAWSSTSTPWSGVGNPYLFTGRRFDAETGLGYYRNRYYSAVLARFLTADPIGLWGDENAVGNPYQYCGNSPAFLSDPQGLQMFFVPPPGPWYAHPAVLIAAGVGLAATGAYGIYKWLSPSEEPATGRGQAGGSSSSPPNPPAPVPPRQPRETKEDPVPQPQPASGGSRKGGRDRARLATPKEIELIERFLGEDIHSLKDGCQVEGSGDIYVLPNGDVVLKPKGGAGPGEPLGVNIRLAMLDAEDARGRAVRSYDNMAIPSQLDILLRVMERVA